jgi:hypothetical protein
MRNIEVRLRKLEAAKKEEATGFAWWSKLFAVSGRLRAAREQGLEPDPTDVAWAERHLAENGGQSLHQHDDL